MKLREIPRTATFAWSSDSVPYLVSGSVAGAVDLDFSAQATLEIWSVGDLSAPLFSANVDSKFHSLAWSAPFDKYTSGLIVASLESGLLEFWDAAVLIRTYGDLPRAHVYSLTKHTGAVKALDFSKTKPWRMASGGQHGEIFVWDLTTFAEPLLPGRAMTPKDEITCVQWNQVNEQVLALVSNGGFTSIWDLRSQREVLHLSYSDAQGKADFSSVAWHPTQLTRLATGSSSDSCPYIMTWDLRNSSVPENIFKGHSKGVMSIDWCAHDSNLLVSSGKDNATLLWNPESATLLTEFIPATNWAFLTRFAPRAPDLFATASFDGKVVVQSLQDTSPPVSEQVKLTDDNEFWSNIATTETRQAVFHVRQAPQWMKRPVSVSFGFGSKIVSVASKNGRSTVLISTSSENDQLKVVAESLTSAMRSNDYTDLIASKTNLDLPDAADWKVLQKLTTEGKNHIFQSIVDEADLKNGHVEEEEEELSSTRIDGVNAEKDDEDDFFSHLAKGDNGPDEKTYVPEGHFQVLGGSQTPEESQLARYILTNQIDKAAIECLKQDKLLEALVLALGQDKSLQDKVKHHYFRSQQNGVLLRLIYSASNRDVLDLVSNGDVANWREIASAVSAYSTDPEDFNSKINELGDRIIASGYSKENRDNALLCYLAGNALDKVASIWIRELEGVEKYLMASSAVLSQFEAKQAALGSFVQKLTAYKSVAHIEGKLSGPTIEAACRIVFEFAKSAAGNGFFELAERLLNELPEDFSGLKAEKERLNRVSGKAETVKAAAKAAPALNGSSRQSGRYGGPTQQRSASVSNLRGIHQPNRAASSPYTNGSNLAPTLPTPPGAPGAPGAPRGSISGKALPRRPARALSHAHLPQMLSHGMPLGSFAPPPNPNASTRVPAPANPYMPNSFGSMSNTDLASGNPSAPLGFRGALRPPSTPTIAQTVTQPDARFGAHPARTPSGHTVLPEAPPKPAYKQDTDGWNDLPDTFKSQSPARRPAASHQPPAPVAAEPTPSAMPSAPKKPATSVMPPPPRVGARAVSKPSTPHMSSSPSVSHSPRLFATNKYAPAPSEVPPAPLTNGSATPHQPTIKKNPYAPAEQTGPVKVSTYAPPHPQPFVSSPAQPPSGHSRKASLSNPYAPSPIMSPPIGSVAPPSIGNSTLIPGSRTASLPTSRPPMRSRPPSLSAAAPPPASGGVSAPPTRTPQFPPQTPPQFSAPPRMNAPPKMTPLDAPPKSVRADQPPQPSSSQTPQTPKLPQPPQVPLALQAPPQSAPPQLAPPQVATPQAPPQSAPPTLTQAPVAPAANDSPAALAVSTVSIVESFKRHLESIKPAAPAKYAKHIADMEKRLNILFGKLSKGLELSEAVVSKLLEIAVALDNKEFPQAGTVNQAILENHGNEAGDWHTGVKRLITMREAFGA